MTGSGERMAASGEGGSELLVVIPDDAVFDAVTEEGTFIFVNVLPDHSSRGRLGRSVRISIILSMP